MSITTSGSAERLDVGQALQDVLNVFTRNFAVFALLGVPLSGIPGALVSLGRLKFSENAAFAILVVVGAIASLVTRPILMGAVMFATLRDLDGEPASFGECLAAGRRKWGTLLGLMILSNLGILVGFILLIVPGIYLALRWAVAGPSVVLTGRGIQESMERSAALTEGRRWAMLLFYVVVWVVLIVVSFLVGLVQGMVNLVAAKEVGAAFVYPLANVCLEVALAVTAAVLYRRLRNHADGAPTAELAEVFA